MCVCRMTPFPGLRSRHALRQRNYWLSTTMPSGARTHAPNTVGNFCFEVTLGYRRLERGR